MRSVKALATLWGGVSEQSRNVRFAAKSFTAKRQKPAQNSPAIARTTGLPQHCGLVPSRPPFTAPKESLDGWTQGNIVQREGNGRSAAMNG